MAKWYTDALSALSALEPDVWMWLQDSVIPAAQQRVNDALTQWHDASQAVINMQAEAETIASDDTQPADLRNVASAQLTAMDPIAAQMSNCYQDLMVLRQALQDIQDGKVAYMPVRQGEAVVINGRVIEAVSDDVAVEVPLLSTGNMTDVALGAKAGDTGLGIAPLMGLIVIGVIAGAAYIANQIRIALQTTNATQAIIEKNKQLAIQAAVAKANAALAAGDQATADTYNQKAMDIAAGQTASPLEASVDSWLNRLFLLGIAGYALFYLPKLIGSGGGGRRRYRDDDEGQG